MTAQKQPLRWSGVLRHARGTANTSIIVQAEQEMEKYPWEDWLRSVPATELFDFMAAKLIALAQHLGKK